MTQVTVPVPKFWTQRIRIPALESHVNGLSLFGMGASFVSEMVIPCIPIRGTDRNVARISAGSASKLRIADRHERTFFWNLIKVRHPFSLGVTMVHQPFLAFKRRSAVGIERLVAMKKDFPLLMEKLQRRQADAREPLHRSQSGIRPALRPVGSNKHDGPFWNAPVLRFPVFDVGDLRVASSKKDTGERNNGADTLPHN